MRGNHVLVLEGLARRVVGVLNSLGITRSLSGDHDRRPH